MPKVLVVCADGTWNDEDAKGAPTNVAKLHANVQTYYVEGVNQWVYYHSGVGTSPGDRIAGGLFGTGINRNIRDCYTFLVENYEVGDELYFFGFSRGAYTVRSLAGLLRNSGIVEDERQIRAAFDLYRSRKDADKPAGANARAFRGKHAKRAKTYTADAQYNNSPEIKFLGVWDTVGSLGYPLPFSSLLKPILSAFGVNWWFHDTQLSTTVKYAYHALAIHERRSDFGPTLWTRQADQGGPKRPDQVLEQVFFTGVHSDVGGGYGGAGLSDVAYRWMLAKAAGAGLCLRAGAHEPGIRLAPNPLGRLHDSFAGVFRLADVLRGRFRGAPRVFPAGAEYAGAIADSAVERFRRMRGTPWPDAGGGNSFRVRVTALAKGATELGPAAEVLGDLTVPLTTS